VVSFCEHGNEHLFFMKYGELLVRVCACCAVGSVHYVMWDRHHLCPSSVLKYRKGALLVCDCVVEKFCKVWVLAWDVSFLEEGFATF